MGLHITKPGSGAHLLNEAEEQFISVESKYVYMTESHNITRILVITPYSGQTWINFYRRHLLSSSLEEALERERNINRMTGGCGRSKRLRHASKMCTLVLYKPTKNSHSREAGSHSNTEEISPLMEFEFSLQYSQQPATDHWLQMNPVFLRLIYLRYILIKKKQNYPLTGCGGP